MPTTPYPSLHSYMHLISNMLFQLLITYTYTPYTLHSYTYTPYTPYTPLPHPTPPTHAYTLPTSPYTVYIPTPSYPTLHLPTQLHAPHFQHGVPVVDRSAPGNGTQILQSGFRVHSGSDSGLDEGGCGGGGDSYRGRG